MSEPAGCGETAQPRYFDVADGLQKAAPAELISDLLSAVRHFHETAQTWHHKEPEASIATSRIAATALHLHAMNFGLWHQEDAVRRPGAEDQEVARRKRSIDDLNARRNASIEDIDLILIDGVSPDHSARLHTETPGMIVDRLSILALRILHTRGSAHPDSRLTVLEEQYNDLFGGLEHFLTGIQLGEVRFKLYRQFKFVEQQSDCALFVRRDT